MKEFHLPGRKTRGGYVTPPHRNELLKFKGSSERVFAVAQSVSGRPKGRWLGLSMARPWVPGSVLRMSPE
jgi:hypothetical protein